MLLNCLGQPTLFRNRKSYLNFEEFKEAPLLLCHKNALDENSLPAGWTGSLFSTQEILNEIVPKEFLFQPASLQALCPNETYIIDLPNNDKFQYKAKNIEITAIPWSNEYLLYLIKEDNIVSLLADMITEDMTALVENKILRNSIKRGIDVLYVNDGIYHSSKNIKLYPSEFLLGALATIIRPRFIKGLFSEEQQLPLHIEACCINDELF